MAGRKSIPIKDRFWEKVDVRGPDECWPWNAGCGSNGRGAFGMKVDGKNTMQASHRVAFFFTHGYWPEFACHTCDNNICCNPKHIYDGTPLMNSTDMVQRFRTNRIAWSAEQFETALRMRRAGMTIQAIADYFGVHYDTVSRAFSGETKTWKHYITPSLLSNP